MFRHGSQSLAKRIRRWMNSDVTRLNWSLSHTLKNEAGFPLKQTNFLFNEMAEIYLSEELLAEKRELRFFRIKGGRI